MVSEAQRNRLLAIIFLAFAFVLSIPAAAKTNGIYSSQFATPTPPSSRTGTLQCDPEFLNRDIVFIIDTSNPIQPDLSADRKLFYIKTLLKGMFDGVTDWGTMRSVVLQYGSRSPNAYKMELCDNAVCFDKQVEALMLADDDAHYLANPLSALTNSHFSSTLKDDVAIIIINDGYWMYEDAASDGAMKVAMMLKQQMHYSISAVTVTQNRLVAQKMKGIVSDTDYNYVLYEFFEAIQYRPRNYIYRWVCNPSVIIVTPPLPDVTTPQPLSKCPQYMDVVVLLHIRYDDKFGQMVRFAAELMKGFSIDSGLTRVALVGYGASAHVEHNLYQGQSQQSVVKSILGVSNSSSFYQPGRNLMSALQMTLDMVLKLRYGDREFAPNTVILITDEIDEPDANLMKLIEEKLNTVAVTLAVGTEMAANVDGQKRLMMVTSSTPEDKMPRTFFQPKIEDLLSGAGGMYRRIIKSACDITGPLTVVPPMTSVCIPVSGPTPPMEPPTKDAQVDIILVVDVSRLVNDVGFKEIKAYIINVLSPYTISPMMTRVALVTYDLTPMVQFYLNSYLDMGGLMDRLRYYWMHTDDTHSAHPSIADALEMVLKDIMVGPSVGYRTEKNNFVFVFTTTAPNTHDIMMAQQIRMKGVTVAVIGLDLDYSTTPMLQDLAGNVLNLKMVQGYQSTLTMPANLKFFWRVTLDPKPPRLVNIKADISFVIDTSDIVTNDGFSVIKSFLVNFANPFVVGMNNSQVALVQYRADPSIVLRFNDADSTDKLQMQILDKFIRLMGQNGQNVSGALNMVKDDILKPENGARADVARIVILLMGGPPLGDGSEIITAAAALNNMDNTFVYPVALDRRIPEDLLNMTAYDANWKLMQSDYINTINRMGLSYVYDAIRHYYDLTAALAVKVPTDAIGRM